MGKHYLCKLYQSIMKLLWMAAVLLAVSSAAPLVEELQDLEVAEAKFGKNFKHIGAGFGHLGLGHMGAGHLNGKQLGKVVKRSHIGGFSGAAHAAHAVHAAQSATKLGLVGAGQALGAKNAAKAIRRSASVVGRSGGGVGLAALSHGVGGKGIGKLAKMA